VGLPNVCETRFAGSDLEMFVVPPLGVQRTEHNRRPQRELLRQYQLILAGSTQPIDLAIALDPDFVATAGQLVKSDDFGHFVGERAIGFRAGKIFRRRVVVLRVIFFRVIFFRVIFFRDC